MACKRRLDAPRDYLLSDDFSLPTPVESDFNCRYGDRVFRYGSDLAEAGGFSASNLGDDFDVHLFHHIPRYHWEYEGDF